MGERTKTKRTKTKKDLDPKQVFVILSTTREEIASDVNNMIEGEGWDVPQFKPNDARLTKEFCEAFADASNSAWCDSDEVVDREYAGQHALLCSEFGIDADEEDDD